MVIEPPLVQVVWCELDDSGAIDTLAASLDDAERQRVDRLADPIERRRATVRLARRREILTSLGADPDAPPGSRRWSSSSRHGLGLFAVSSGPRVGVDIEALSEIPDPVRLAHSIATGEEALALAAVTPSERADAVLRLWTRKEAYLKATGEGVGSGVRHVRVPLGLDAWELAFQPGSPHGATWRLYDLDCPRPGYAAALVVELVPAEPRAPHVTVTTWCT